MGMGDMINWGFFKRHFWGALLRHQEAWPLAGIGLAVAANGVWIGVLGYGISKLF